MSRGWRVFYGAILGALAVLIAHPVSRPFLLTALTHWGASQTFLRTDLILSNNAVLPVPAKLLDASLWMDLGSKDLVSGDAMGQDNLAKMLQVADFASRQDPDNAYWEQMKAVFYGAESKSRSFTAAKRAEFHKLAVAAWVSGSNQSRWDDYQTRRLKEIQQQLASESGTAAAWQIAAVYPLRLRYAGECIQLFSRNLLDELNQDSQQALLLRYATLMNGRLLRDGARSIATGEIGAGMVEESSYPPGLVSRSSLKKLVVARTDFYNNLMHRGFHDQARSALDTFKSNEGWLALIEDSELSTQTPDLRIGSLLTIDLPGALLATALIGGLVWLLGAGLQAKPALLRAVEPPLAPLIGLILAGLLYWATHLPLASIAVVACFGFLAFTPQHERTNAPEQLGPVFEILLFLLSCVLAAFLVAFFVGLSTPGCQILPELNVPRDFYGGSTLLLGLSIVVLALLLLSAPAWALAQRIATPTIVALALKQFGRGLFWACLTVAVVGTPLCILGDRNLGNRLDEIVGNEPLYYQLNN